MKSNEQILLLYNFSVDRMFGFGSQIQTLSEALDLPVDLLKMVLLMVINIPLASLFRFVSNAKFRLFYSFSVGLIFLIFLLEQWVLYIIAQILLPYVMFKIVKKHQYLIALLFSICFLVFIHTYRWMYDYMSWKIDCSVPVMYIVTKVVYYGSYLSHHKSESSFFEYISYCLFFPSVVVGPTFKFATFQNFIHMKNGYENPQIVLSSLLKQILKANVFGAATLLLMPTFTPYWPLQNKQFSHLHPFFQFLLLNVIGIIYRSKFYAAWAFHQIAIDISGLSWNQKQKNTSAVVCGSPRFEIELNPRNKTAYWNTSVQIWLKEMIYDQVVSYFKSGTLATFITFFASALWHGVYLTYYVGFIHWALIITISKWGYKMSQALPSLSKNIFVKAIAFLYASSILNYTGMFIVVLTWNEAIQMCKNMNFMGSWFIFIPLFLSYVISPKMFKSKNHKRQQQTQNTAGENKQKEFAKNIEKQRVD